MISEDIKNQFYFFGENVKIGKDVEVTSPGRIFIGNNVEISNNSWLIVHPFSCNKEIKCNLTVHNDVYMNKNVIIEAFNKIEIGRYVLFGPQVYLSDGGHRYNSFHIPIRLQGAAKETNKVIVKDGAWIGTGSRVIGNVTIGFGSVVGANSVIVKDVPDHVIVGGNPSQVIKVCDYRTGEWIKTWGDKELLEKIIDKRGTFQGYDYEKLNKALANSD